MGRAAIHVLVRSGKERHEDVIALGGCRHMLPITTEKCPHVISAESRYWLQQFGPARAEVAQTPPAEILRRCSHAKFRDRAATKFQTRLH